MSTGQLDLFAEAEAAEREEALDAAPCLFDLEQRGYFTRVAELRHWQDTYGLAASLRLSHAWRPDWYAGRDQQPTDVCRPAVLSVDLRCNCDTYRHGDCMCVGDLLYRGACLHCTWEGDPRDEENEAVEDAHDHSWPGWRDLRIVPKRPETASGTSSKEQKSVARWVAAVNKVYPAGWLESGGPIRVRRAAPGTRHVPGRTGFGGYELSGEVIPQNTT